MHYSSYTWYTSVVELHRSVLFLACAQLSSAHSGVTAVNCVDTVHMSACAEADATVDDQRVEIGLHWKFFFEFGRARQDNGKCYPFSRLLGRALSCSFSGALPSLTAPKKAICTRSDFVHVSSEFQILRVNNFWWLSNFFKEA